MTAIDYGLRHRVKALEDAMGGLSGGVNGPTARVRGNADGNHMPVTQDWEDWLLRWGPYSQTSDFAADYDDLVHPMWDPAGDHDRFTVVEPGVYRGTAQILWLPNVNGDRRLDLVRHFVGGGSKIVGRDERPGNGPNSGSSDHLSQQVSGTDEFAAGDYITATCWQNSGGALDTRDLNHPPGPIFTMSRIRT
jgi:hypothetical protein